ncbi:MAG: cytidine deaminase [Methylocella sp.]
MTADLNASQRALLREAERARVVGYAPYSNFKVGAAVRTRSGKIYTGCNIENASYSLSICAERVAIFNAVSNGDQDIVELAVCADAETPSRPCGACRQVFSEFAAMGDIIMGNLNGLVDKRCIQELFPEPFQLND